MASSLDWFWNGERLGVSPPSHRSAHKFDHSPRSGLIHFLVTLRVGRCNEIIRKAGLRRSGSRRKRGQALRLDAKRGRFVARFKQYRSTPDPRFDLFQPYYWRRNSLSGKEKAVRLFRRTARFEEKSGQQDANRTFYERRPIAFGELMRCSTSTCDDSAVKPMRWPIIHDPGCDRGCPK